jgi:hypothetical protein
VLPFSTDGGLKDLKKRSIRLAGNLAIYARWLAPTLCRLISTPMVATTCQTNRFARSFRPHVKTTPQPRAKAWAMLPRPFGPQPNVFSVSACRAILVAATSLSDAAPTPEALGIRRRLNAIARYVKATDYVGQASLPKTAQASLITNRQSLIISRRSGAAGVARIVAAPFRSLSSR